VSRAAAVAADARQRAVEEARVVHLAVTRVEELEQPPLVARRADEHGHAGGVARAHGGERRSGSARSPRRAGTRAARRARRRAACTGAAPQDLLDRRFAQRARDRGAERAQVEVGDARGRLAVVRVLRRAALRDRALEQPARGGAAEQRAHAHPARRLAEDRHVAGSPPKRAMFSRTHASAAIWSSSPRLAAPRTPRRSAARDRGSRARRAGS
jgi:hypothetical protein